MYTDEQVKVETDVNVTSHGSDDVTRDVMEECASRLNASVQRVHRLDQVLAEQMSVSDDDGGLTRRPLTVIQATTDCPEARMTPAGFLYLSSGWQCPRDLVLDRHLWRCVSRVCRLLLYHRRSQVLRCGGALPRFVLTTYGALPNAYNNNNNNSSVVSFLGMGC